MKKSQTWVKNRVNKKEKAKSHAFIRFLYIFLLMCFLTVFIYTFIFSEVIRINNIEVKGNVDLSRELIANEIQTRISGKYFRYFNKNNYIFIRKKFVKDFLKERFKKIESVKVEKIFPNTLKIDIKERNALVVWCCGEICYLLDEKGYAYTQTDLNSDFIVANNLIKIMDESGHFVNLGDTIWGEENIKYIREIKKAFSDIGVKMDNQISVLTQVSDTLNIMTDQGWILKLSFQRNNFESAASLDLFFKYFDQLGNVSDLEYIDLRVKNKIFYKLKQKEEERSVESEDLAEEEVAGEQDSQAEDSQVEKIKEEEENNN